MQLPKINNPQLVKIVASYWQWRLLWIATTVCFAALALIYVAFLKTDTWVASQAFIVRDEANGASMRLGRFASQTEMKAAQETILEMARNPQVLHDALTALGREPSWTVWLLGQRPPTTSEIENLARNGIQVRAPRGAELGTTEVIYLDVKNKSPQRALKLNRAVCDALVDRLQHIRQVRADGVLAELRTAKETAQAQLMRATERLTEMETQAGADLSDLRGMTDSNSGGSSTRQVLDAIKSELRQAELQLQQIEVDLKLAIESHQNPDQLLLTPSSLVNSQAGLKTLRDGLANATITTSQMQGRYTSTHPLVVASVQAETNLREQLRDELRLSILTLKKDSEIASERLKKLNLQRSQLESRLEKIARIRADYANVVSEVKSRNQQLQESERELIQAQASRDAALTSSLITRLGEPQLGEKPIGPGRSTILAGATASGLLFGLGIVFLLAPLDGGASYGRRRFDYSGLAGRRATDREQLDEGRQDAPSNPSAGSRRSDAVQLDTMQPGAPAAASGSVDRRRSSMMPTTEPERAKATRPLPVTQKLTGVLESWKSSQSPIQPTPRPEPASRPSRPTV